MDIWPMHDLRYGTDPQADAEVDYSGPNWRGDPLEDTPPVRREYGEQCADTRGDALERAVALAATAPAWTSVAKPLPGPAIRPFRVVRGLHCGPF